MTVVSFILFNIIFFFSSRGILVSFKIFTKKDFIVDQLKVFNIPLFIFYQVLAMFLLGNLTIIFNFFGSFNRLKYLLLLLLSISLLINLKEKFLFESKSVLVYVLLLVPFVLSFSSYGLKLHFDSVDYHLNFQNWVRESKIAFGLINLYPAYGWSTIYDYILSNFWFKDNFILLHFVNLLFFAFFYNFLIYSLLYSKDFFLKTISINILIFGFLDNFGVGGGGNGFLSIQMIGKPDLSVGILFFICFVLFVSDFLKDSYEINNFILLSSLSLFAYQIKIVSSGLIFLLIFYIFKLYPKFSIFNIFKKVYILFFVLFIYIIKNIFISGCYIFPISFTCIDSLFWSNKKLVDSFSNSVTSGNNFALNNFDNLSSWFISWINHGYNMQVYSNFIISIILIFLFNYLFFEKNKSENTNSKLKLLYIFTAFLTLTFFVTGPTIRYGYGLFLIIVSVIGVKNKNFRFEISKTKINLFYLALIFSTIILTPRIYSYNTFLKNPLTFYKPIDSISEYLQHPALINETEVELDSTECFILKTCIKESLEKINEEENLSYIFYYVDKSS